MFGHTRWGRRRHAFDEPFPDPWRDLLGRRLVHWGWLDDEERAQMEDLIRYFIVDKRWEEGPGFDLTEDRKVLISAMACLLVLGLDYGHYAKVSWISVQSTTVVLGGTRAVGQGLVTDDPLPILGQAVYEGPVTIAWDSAEDSARHPERGHNVVYHEFAHKLDMADGSVDGTPPVAAEDRQRWIDVCTREFEALRDGRVDGLLDPYGATNPAEFFAVATELFFDRPVDMERHHGELYAVLRDFYRQDPAVRARRARR
jgi:Mlc titration factor MtfA (ptsG expression regulator)